MCTAATYKTKDFYFGRTLDYEFSYGDEITITPRNYEFKFKETEQIKNHYAIIGMAYVAENYPLYYDAINEKGLGIAGLNFVGNTHYSPKEEEKGIQGLFPAADLLRHGRGVCHRRCHSDLSDLHQFQQPAVL